MRSITDYFGETFYYFLIGGLIVLTLIILIAISSIPFAIAFEWDGSKWINQFRHFCLLFFLAFVFGAVLNLAWYSLLNERFYVLTDPFLHFLPFLPFGWFLVNVSIGHLQPGVKMWRLRALWVLSALITWLASVSVNGLIWGLTRAA